MVLIVDNNVLLSILLASTSTFLGVDTLNNLLSTFVSDANLSRSRRLLLDLLLLQETWLLEVVTKVFSDPLELRKKILLSVDLSWRRLRCGNWQHNFLILGARAKELRSRVVEVCQQGVIDSVATEEIERFIAFIATENVSSERTTTKQSCSVRHSRLLLIPSRHHFSSCRFLRLRPL